MLLVGNGKVITRDQEQPYLAEGCVAIDGELIAKVGPTAKLKAEYDQADFIDAKGRLVMPGLINTHMHLYSTFARGMALKDPPPQNFVEILERLWWRLDRSLTPDDIYYSAMVPLIDSIKNGTTTLFDHHASAGSVRGSLSTLARAAREAGVRCSLCYEVSDRDGEAIMREGIRENADFLKSIKPDEGMVRGLFGLHASFTLSDQTLERCRLAAGEAGFHVHVAEGEADRTDALARSGGGVVERLDGFGIIGPDSIAAHCVHIDQEEIGLLAARKANCIHNPESNMGNAVGYAPVMEMLKRGVTVGMGTDGYTTDLFESYKVANLLHKHQSGNPSAAWEEVPQLLFEENAAIASHFFPHPVGRLAPDGYADLIIVDYAPPTPLQEDNIDSHLLFGVSGRDVVTTIINGQVIMEERQLTRLDEERIRARARELAAKLWQRF